MIIRNDTVWRAGDVIKLKETVQVAPGATLTIEKGAIVRGGAIQVFGNLSVEGSHEKRVHFHDVALTFGSSHRTPGSIEMAFTSWSGGDFLGSGGYGSFSVSDSSFNGTNGFYIWYPTSDSDFTRNVFSGSSPLSIGTDTSATVFIDSNSFVNPQSVAIYVWAAYGDPVQLHHNTFSIPKGSLAIEFGEGYSSAAANADENYWGTTDRSLIGRMILDAKDSLERASVATIANPLTTPYADAPVVGLIVRGTRADDTLAGMQGDDVIFGMAGKDKLFGGAGNDIYIVDNVRDVVVEATNHGIDLIQSSVSYTLAANIENLSLLGTMALSGTGNKRANMISGNAASNRLSGLAGNDTLDGGGGNDTLDGGLGKDFLNGGAGNDRLVGGARNDTLGGGGGNDKLDGGAGKDVLNGGAGNDRLIGGTQSDRLTGGAGADTFVFVTLLDSTRTAAGRDTITDFSRSQHDQIDLKAIDANTHATGNQAFRYLGDAAFTGNEGELSARIFKGGTLISGDVDGDRVADFTIFLDDQLTLSADSFIL